jgi:predicted AAA+ superfamily ATPase
LLDLTSIGNDLGINYKTVRAWVSVLEASFIVFLLYPHHQNYNKRLIKSPKLYFYDTGLLCSLLGLQAASQLDTHYLRGSIFENYVLAEVFKQHVHSGRRPEFYFWRDNAGNEVDLLIEQGVQRQVVEIKSGATLNENLFKGLKYYRKLAAGSLPEHDYYLVYGGDQNQTRQYGRVLSWKEIEVLSGG